MHNKKMYPKRKHNKKSVPFILAWAGLVIGILVIAYGITINLDDFGANTLVYNGIGNKLWFGYLQQFTILTNILLIIFYLLFLTAYRTRIFNTNSFLVFTVSYITLVFTIAWFIMAPIFVLQNMTHTDFMSALETILVHIVTPILFLVFAIFTMRYPKPDIKKELPYIKILLYASIWPFIYFLYAIVINYIPVSINTFGSNVLDRHEVAYRGHLYISIYSILTNYNHHCYIPIIDNAGQWDLKVEGTDNFGNPIRLLVVPVILIYYCIEQLLFTYINNRCCNAYTHNINEIKAYF